MRLSKQICFVLPLWICALCTWGMIVDPMSVDGQDVAVEGGFWKAGAAKVCITPEEPMWMSGYGSRDKPSEGKLTDLWVKALVLQDPQGREGVLLTMDLVGVDRVTAKRMCDRLQQDFGYERQQILLNTSHTHTGPVVGRNLGAMLNWRLQESDLKKIDDYADRLVNQVVEVVGEARRNKEKAILSWGSGNATFAVNRRTNVEATVPESRTAEALKGPCDHDVPVLAVRDEKGNLRSLLFGYACHSTVLSSYQWSGDYPGFAQMEIESLHPGCVALFWAGCGADQNPLPRRTEAHARHYGRRLADAVDSVLLTSKMKELKGELAFQYSEIDLPFDTIPGRESWLNETASKDPFVASRAKMLLKEIDEGRPLPTKYPYPVSAWKIGEIQWVALGGEVVVDFALRIKTEQRGKRTWVAGYSNDVMAYIPSRRVLTEGGYEGGGAMVYYGLPAPWGADVEERIIAEVTRQLRSLEGPSTPPSR